MSEEKKEVRQKMIFAKATSLNFCAIVVYRSNGTLKVCDIVESASIDEFIPDVVLLARKHKPELLQYECSVYIDECKALRSELYNDSVRVRGYRSEGVYLNRVVSQAAWIESNVLVNDKFTFFIDQLMSFSTTDPDKSNIALDVLSDATLFLRRYWFK